MSSFLIFPKNGINFAGQLFDSDGKLHSWEFLKEKYLLSQNMKFKWFQLIHALPRKWKEAISMHDGNLENLLIQDHHLIKKNQILCLTKLNSNELYKIHIMIKHKKPTLQSQFGKIFENSSVDWKTIYLLPRIATVDTTIRVFQYRLLNNVLFLNKMLYRFVMLLLKSRRTNSNAYILQL